MTSLHADEAFLGHYQLSHDPFAARVPGFKFFPAQRKPVLGQLHHLARYSQLLLVVTGPKGSGKTLLRQALVASTNKQSVHSVVVSARGAVEAGGVLRLISQGLNVPQADVGDVLQRVAELVATGQEVYLLVDDAEQLDDASLDAMMALAAGNADGRAHVFLFADANLVPRLELYADGAECFHVIELQPYSEDETREYLAQRLEGAGQGIELFSERQVADIHLGAAGWPGAINLMAREALIDAMLVQRGASQRAAGAGFKLPIKHLLALLVVAGGVAGAWMMQDRSASVASAPVVAQLPLGQEVPPAALVEPVVTPESLAASGPKIDFAGSSQPVPLPLAGEAQPVIRQPLAQAAGTADVDDAAELPAAVLEGVTPATALSAPSAVPGLPIAASAAVAALPPAKAETSVAAPAAVEPVPAVAAQPLPKAQAAPVVAPKVAVKPTAKPAVVVAKAPVPSVAPKAAAAGAGWYGAQPSSRYVVQVLGTGVEANAQAFVRQQGADYHYFKRQLQGKANYVVTYGSFATRAAAQAAVAKLPAKIQAGKPWPRTIASVQQEIK
jgi:DamX protein